MVVDFSDTPDRPSDSEPKKGIQFWLIFVAISLATFLAALDTSIIFIALPTITESLKSEELYVWIIITYLLASTVSAPQFDQAADIFDRRSSTTIAIILLAVGNVLAGAAKNTGMMLAGRTVQGIGGGGVATPSEIIVCEMVSLRERGLYAGIIGSVWAIAAVVGPIIEAILASLPESEVALATGTWTFIRNLGSIWGVAVPSTVFNTRADKLVYQISDPAVQSLFLSGRTYEHSTRDFVNTFRNNSVLYNIIIHLYVSSLKVVWQASIGFSGSGFLLTFLLRAYKLRDQLNTEYRLETEKTKPAASEVVTRAKGSEGEVTAA